MKTLKLKYCLSFFVVLTLTACGEPPEKKSTAPTAEALEKAGQLESAIDKATLRLTELGCQFQEVKVISKNTNRKTDYQLICSPALTNVAGAADPLSQLRNNHSILNEYKLVAGVLVRNKTIEKALRNETALKSYAVELQLRELKSIIDSLSESESAQSSADRIASLESQLTTLKCAYQGETKELYQCETVPLMEGLIRFERLMELVRALNIGMANSFVTIEVKRDWHNRRQAVTEEYAEELVNLRKNLRSTPLREVRKLIRESLDRDSLMEAIGSVDMEIKLHILTRPEEEDDDQASQTIQRNQS